MNCSRDSDETGNYNGSTDILEIEFIFNDNKHAGFYLRITTDCNSSSIALIPCRFSTYVDFYNNSTILVICQNPTFINSSSPMIIQEYRGNQYVSCTPQKCFDNACKNLPDGIQCVLPYDPNKLLQCKLYGAVFNITTPSSDIMTTSQGSSPTPQNTEITESLKSSSTLPSITSKSAEGSTSENDKSTSLTLSDGTESDKTIYTMPRGSTDMTTSSTNVHKSKLSSKSSEWKIHVAYSSILTIALITVFVICVCRRFRKKGEENSEKKMP